MKKLEGTLDYLDLEGLFVSSDKEALAMMCSVCGCVAVMAW